MQKICPYIAGVGTGSVEWDLRKFTLDFIGNQSFISIKSTI
jgi:hypothetical protein